MLDNVSNEATPVVPQANIFDIYFTLTFLSYGSSWVNKSKIIGIDLGSYK